MRYIITAMTTAAAVGLPACGSGGVSPAASHDVEVVECRPVTVNCGGEYDGVIRPHRMIDVSSRAEGVLQHRLFDEGAEIVKGQPLFQIDDKVYRAKVDEARANVEKARANELKAKRDLDRIRPLYEANAASRLDLDNAVAAYEGARADVEISRAHLALARVALDDTRILAPMTGFISRSNVDEGAYVSPGSGALATMLNVDTVNVEFSLTAAEYARSRTRGYCFDALCTNPDHERVYHVLVTNADGTPYPVEGVVDFAAHRADATTGKIIIRAKVPNMPHTLMPGAPTRVRVLGESSRTILALPRESVVGEGDARYVMVRSDDGRFVRRPVSVVPLSPDSVIVDSGVSAGEYVAIGMVTDAKDR
ncbi:MAG: efflux RND transporter periplasmic adaptor subunit [Pseudoflavonifractor sp.]|nr:efflux RND transporter periplasmic adaptor subunit [Pseudoflavonifractor sp.]